MAKNHNISALITLAACAVAVLCCLLNHVPILNTLKYVLIVLLVFWIVGRIAERIVFRINEAAEMAAVQAEEEARKAAQQQAEEAADAAQKEEVTEDESGNEPEEV